MTGKTSPLPSELYSDIVGDGDDCVLWLHGFLGSRVDFAFAAEALKSEFRSVLVDLPGHGKSALGSAVSFQSWAVEILRLLDHHQVNKAHVAAYSMGGRLALYLALHHPDRIKTLVLESSSPGIAGRRERLKRCELDERRSASLREGGMASFLHAWYRASVFTSLKSSPEVVEQLVATRLDNRASDLAVVVAAVSPGRQPSLWKYLPALAAPTLCLAGQRDGRYVAIARRMESVTPLIERRIVSHVGHSVHLEAPEAYLDLVRNFLSRRRRPVACKRRPAELGRYPIA